MIPAQRPPHTTCTQPDCGAELHWVNRPTGATLVHATGSEWCGSVGDVLTTRARAAGVGL